jgi:SAM-dependent methyltransferase
VKHPLDMSWLYRAWQAPFVAQKLALLQRRHPGLPFRRVLDLGCGPGINAAVFRHTEYLGIDIDAGYIRDARARFGDRFQVGDAANLDLAGQQPFDCILVNSLLHHLDDAQVFVIDLVVPVEPGLPRTLALADRGHFPRALPHLRGLITRSFCLDAEEPFRLHLGPLTMWQMVYYEARVCG